jgi:hypothetical protein
VPHRDSNSCRVALLAFAVALAVGCTEWVDLYPEGDADADGDADGDSDGDADGDADGDGDGDWPPPGCGRLNQVCCDGERRCVERTTCAGMPDGTGLCLEDCVLASCPYGEEAGYCQDVGEIGICASVAPSITSCTSGETGCWTEYGVSTDTVCVPDRQGNLYCFEICVPAAVTCPEGYNCFELQSGAGAVCGVAE